eukprot:scaffold22285_cov70-Cyclotella_meneghiniana.AAC.12
MYNTRHLRRTNKKALDLGIVSFFGTALSSLCMLRMSYGGTMLFCCKRRGKMTTNNEQDDGYYLDSHRKSSRDVVDHSPPGEAIRVTLGDEYITKKSKHRNGCRWLCNYLLAYCYRKLVAKQNRDANDDELNADDDDEDDEVDEELRALYAGPGKKGYLNINY